MFLPGRSRLLSVPFYVPCRIYFFCFARILFSGFQLNSWEVIDATNRLNRLYTVFLAKLKGTRIREKIRIGVSRFSRHVKQVLTPSE